MLYFLLICFIFILAFSLFSIIRTIRNINKQIKQQRKIRVSLSNRDIEELAYAINQKGVFTIKNSTKSLDDIDVNLLFNKFYTVDKSRTKGSSGLGLYIVKELLKKIDGKIENVSYEKNILSISICFPLYNDKKLL